ncbi:MAG: SH3 domain-containing protein [Anaerolineae bacterium]|nr:SH3 domain-containing protein [Anaerolineae bacterium]
MGNAIGPDVSFYQDEPETPEHIDFVQMNKVADFAIIRAGQNLWVDRDFKSNWAEAKKAGIPRGTYWFYDSRANPKRQAELWVDAMDGDFGELPLFADFEESYGGQYKGWKKWFDFLERLKELINGKEISIYTAFYYWRDNAPNPNRQREKLEYFGQYPLWIANYGAAQPNVPKPWGPDEWLFWQFTEVGDGDLYGVESRGVDLNYFNGEAEAFRERFDIEPPGPMPTVSYKVDLSVRVGPGIDEDVVKTLEQDEVLELISESDDGKWNQVRRPDETTGWIRKDILVALETTEPPETGEPPDTGEPTEPTEPPDTDEPPDEDESEYYQVTSIGLNVREGPGVSFDKIGVLKQNQVVKALEFAAANSWIRIMRVSDGLTGWSSARFLTQTDIPEEPGPGEPPDTGEPSPPEQPPPVVEILRWYQVKVTTLNVREGPNTSDEKLGVLRQSEIVIALEFDEAETWARIQRFDGLAGWCAIAYLNDLGEAAPEQLTQKIFSGVTYFRKENHDPRKMVAHVLAIDMRANGLKTIVTPPSENNNNVVCSRKTSKFLDDFGLQLAVNGDGFKYLDQDEFDPGQNCPNGGEPLKVNSYAASRGKVYSQRWDKRPILYINKKNEVTFNKPKGNIFNAISGDRMLVEKGKVVSNLEDQSVEPRTAIGTNQNGRWLFLVVIDGRQADYSEGATFPELADFLKSLGVYTGLNLDGGGSSTMVIEGALDQPFVLNIPIEGNIRGNEAAVSNHFGLKVKK